MRIKRLELCGFKSFVEPTSLEFARGISGIVGPNGCGKSNLVDALRWVLGEQSAKRLRGDAMEDVIFNGTDSGRGPAGMAEVSLLLDNEEGTAEREEPSEIIRQLGAVPEIQVTRRYFRSGESEYLINGRPCRLKDVTELFLGTGVGTKAYAMIEQGRVEQLVNAKPEDVRLFIEEAAGTTLYRDRRLAAERKMERTRDNLARVNDILQEIDRSIAMYRRLAKRAEQHRLALDELRTVELQLARRKLDRLDAELREVDGRRTMLCERERTLAEEIERLERGRDVARAELAAAEDELRRRQEALFEVRNARTRTQARLEMLEREDTDGAEQRSRLDAERGETQAKIAELAAEITDRDHALVELASRNHVCEADLAANVVAVDAEEERVAALGGEVEQKKTESVERQRAEAELRNRIRALEERSGERRRRRDTVTGEIATADAEAARMAAELDTLAARRAALEESGASASVSSSAAIRAASASAVAIDRKSTRLNSSHRT